MKGAVVADKRAATDVKYNILPRIGYLKDTSIKFRFQVYRIIVLVLVIDTVLVNELLQA